MTGIVNIINFIRDIEPRIPELDLVEPVVNQIKLVEKYGLAATWLVQYDTLLDNRFTDLLKNLDERQEVGAWFEVVQPMVEAAGIKWRGRYSWDWHVNVGFSIGYSKTEREKLADVFMEKFKQVFGQYPQSVGSWFIDAHTLEYLYKRYGITASCNCKDQWGTDGYTLWGGYYNQAYYPSRVNSYMPAQHSGAQIPVPVFRMLGSDPIYQYEAGIDGGAQDVITLEPVYPGVGGGSKEWVDWFLNTNFRAPSLSFGYTQVGQENSFGWPAMANGLTYQIEQLSKMVETGEIRVETLADSAKWFKTQYKITPSSAICALEDWSDRGKKSIWYCSRFYRTNLFWDESGFKVRDIHLFDERYTEPFLKSVCEEHACTYDTLPIIDGLLWSDSSTRAGIRVYKVLSDGSRQYITADNPEVEEKGDSLIIKCGDGLKITCGLYKLSFELTPSSDIVSWGLEMSWAGSKSAAITTAQDGIISYEHNGYQYTLGCDGGTISCDKGSSLDIVASKDRIVLGCWV